MIDDPRPSNWRQLQSGVCRLFNEVGLTGDVGRKLQTPRGEIEVDFYAVDERSVDRITYLVECKNWDARVPRSVVHSFTTVMHETGANIGFIVSREGFQSGARRYFSNTNIVGLTYLELQQRYFEQWFSKFFRVTVGAAVDCLIQYLEPINGRRERFLRQLPAEKQERVKLLQSKYARFGLTVAFVGFSPSAKQLGIDPLTAVAELKHQLAQAGADYPFASIYFRDLAYEIGTRALEITKEFHAAFGRNIFSA
jgi:hypothetical protein